MIRFAYLQEAYLYEIYRDTIARGGQFRFPAKHDPLPALTVPETLLQKCLSSLVAQGRLEFRQDRSGSNDGYEISGSGLIYVEDQFEEFEDRPRTGTTLYRALQAAYGDAAKLAPAATVFSSVGSQHVRYIDAEDAITAVACAVAMELAEGAAGHVPTAATVRSRAILLAPPQVPKALLTALIDSAVARLAETGHAVETRNTATAIGDREQH